MATHAAFIPGTALRSRVWAWLTTVDHKRVGVLYGTTAFAFFLLGGLEVLLMRAQLARPDNTLVSADDLQRVVHHARDNHRPPSLRP
jgi:cytochrome c oxidase subunit 1